MKRISALGLDVGHKRIGVAGCDGTGLIATGLTTIHRISFQADVAELRLIIQARSVEVLVIGLPFTLKGELGHQAKQVQKFARRLEDVLHLPFEYVDERLTSVEAETQLKAQKRFSSWDKGLIDRQAATIILQQWLDQRRGGMPLSSPDPLG